MDTYPKRLRVYPLFCVQHRPRNSYSLHIPGPPGGTGSLLQAPSAPPCAPPKRSLRVRFGSLGLSALSRVPPALVQHGEIAVQRDVVGHAVPGSQTVPAPRLTRVERLSNPLPNRLLAGAAQEIHIDPAQ